MNSITAYKEADTNTSAGGSPRLFTKIYSDTCGHAFRLTFLVAIVNGQIKARLISAQPVVQLKGKTCRSTAAVCLPVYAPNKETTSDFASSSGHIVSPYIELFFLTSQPTRAPSSIL